jgi:septal ring factor EnvC (AmiA/AmiB activator)
MKKIAILLSLAAFVLTLASCGGPEADAKEMMKKIEKYTEVAKKVAEDQKIDDKEVEELKTLSKELDEFEKKMTEKYKDDKDAEEKMKKFEEENKAEMEKIYDEFFNAMMALYECEGADKLEL